MEGSPATDTRSSKKRRHFHRSPCPEVEPPSSWFSHAYLAINGRPFFCHPHHVNEADRSCALGSGGGDDGFLLQRIQSVSRQLSLVKQRLCPSAERCAGAANRLLLQRGSGEEATSASREFQEARRVCNPYEALGEGRRGGLNNLFMNRSAIKLANLDAILGFALTEVGDVRPDGAGATDPGSAEFRFVDLCGAPGGFSEYLLRRCRANQRPCRGYGMSLRGNNDQGTGLPWRLVVGKADCPFEADDDSLKYRFFICHGADGTGDIYNWKNVEHMKGQIEADILKGCNAVGCCSDLAGRVHLVVADGGVDAQRDAGHQEALTQKLVVCQASAALELVAPGGTIILKMFGFQTDVIRSMVQDLVQCFDRTIAIKPISSRPASAERYVFFSGFRYSTTVPRGVQWQSRVFLGDSAPPLAAYSEEDAKHLRRHVDRFDLDMLTLNLETCFSILSVLERKCRFLLESNGEEDTDVAMTIDSDDNEPIPVNIAAYRRAWRLE
jgi:cap1 methyltransferase